jgi:hypothetical protein
MQVKAVDRQKVIMLNNKIKTAQVIGKFLAEKGIYDPKSILPSQYAELDGPVRVILIKRLFGSWGRAMGFVAKHMPEKPAPEPKPEPKPKTAPKAETKPAPVEAPKATDGEV